MSFDVLKNVAVKPEGMVPMDNLNECPPLTGSAECEKFKTEASLNMLRMAAHAWNDGSEIGKKVAVRLIRESSLYEPLNVLGSFARFVAELPEKARHLLGVDKK